MTSHKVYTLFRKVYIPLDRILPSNKGILCFPGILRAKNQRDAAVLAKFEAQ